MAGSSHLVDVVVLVRLALGNLAVRVLPRLGPDVAGLLETLEQQLHLPHADAHLLMHTGTHARSKSFAVRLRVVLNGCKLYSSSAIPFSRSAAATSTSPFTGGATLEARVLEETNL